ncbi:MAG: hypothetical protein ABSG80_15050 [Verrucomicrobiota bacterium]|jgi:hypothetical protein
MFITNFHAVQAKCSATLAAVLVALLFLAWQDSTPQRNIPPRIKRGLEGGQTQAAAGATCGYPG